tara:strand:+ start:2225 stop:2884 length:660 start_codon:yes stop_codon:yes gene_type:complete
LINLKRPVGVLFDWDNTLVNTWPVIHDAMNFTLEKMGYPLWSLEDSKKNVRLSLRQSFPKLFGDKWETARDIFYMRFKKIHLKRLEVLPGAEELLISLKKKGVYLGVVSNKSGENLRREANHLGWNQYFGKIIGATDAKEDKPSIKPVQLAIKGSGIELDQRVWFVGDTKIDMECAYNSGCFPILINKNTPMVEEFGRFMPKIYLMNCEKLRKIFYELG